MQTISPLLFSAICPAFTANYHQQIFKFQDHLPAMKRKFRCFSQIKGRCRLCHLGRLRGRTHTVSRGNAGDWAPSQTTEKRCEQRPLRGAVSTTTQPGPGCHTNIHTPPTGPAGPQGTARSRTRCWAGLHSPSPRAVAPFSYGFYRYCVLLKPYLDNFEHYFASR